jgi:N-acetylglucosaminyldiphosphoundecaprenol N-acetyl-beta-D-mannosaminyltransferase
MRRSPASMLPPMPQTELQRFDVLGVMVHACSFGQALERVLAARGQTGLGYVCFCNAHGIVEAQDDPGLKTIYDKAYLATPDGMPLVWLGKRCGFGHVERVYGPDLLLAACNAGRALGLRHYFYGGREGVAEALVELLQRRFPGLQVAGFSTPPEGPLSDAERATLESSVASTRPDLLWVGLGAPKQERFMALHAPRLQAGLLLGVGAAFDFHSGRVRQAPRWMQRGGLEWLHRLSQEPRRLGKRYLTTTPRFALGVAWQLLRGR